jgi:uncharacterized membrane protein YfcA
MALVAAPILLLIDTALVPGPLIVSGLILVAGMAVREFDAAEPRDMAWAVTGCAFGTAAAAAVLIVIDPGAFELVFGLMLLVAVGLSVVKTDIRPSKWLVLGAGTISGLMGTTTSVGGPPLAFIYQHSTGPRLRATMSVYFLAAGTLAVGGLALAGRFGLGELKLSLYLIPGLVVGLLVSNHTRGWLKKEYVRPAVLLLCSVAALFVLARYFLR